MGYMDYFFSFAKEIDRFLNFFLEKKIKESEKINPLASDIWIKIKNFISGGKRIRGGLVKLGYECFRGKKKRAILPIASALEITHGAILIHDDIIDRSDFRHHQPTVHRNYESYHKKNYQKGDPSHYGEGMALIVGDAGFYEGISLIEKSSFPPDLKLKCLGFLAKLMIHTCYGEILDVDLSFRSKVSEEEIMLVNRLKTAEYTIVGPLKIGGILAGADPKKLKKFEDYGFAVGIAFQIQDDILGMFGSFEKLGKPVDSDIKEGKNTLLYTQALKRGNKKQRERLKSLWGKEDITQEEVEEAREIIRKTGSLSYSQNLARKLVNEAKTVVPNITQDENLKNVFLSLADFVIERGR